MTRPTPALLATLLRAAADAVERGELELRADGDAWVSQHDSPLGRKAHCAAVRSGALPGSKVGRKVLVRRRDLDAFITAHAVSAAEPAADRPLSAELQHLGWS